MCDRYFHFFMRLSCTVLHKFTYMMVIDQFSLNPFSFLSASNPELISPPALSLYLYEHICPQCEGEKKLIHKYENKEALHRIAKIRVARVETFHPQELMNIY